MAIGNSSLQQQKAGTLDIILVHLGGTVLPYLVDCIRQIRLFTDAKVVVVLASPDGFRLDFKDVVVVDIDKLPKTTNWQHFEKTKFFPKPNLWRYSCERLFAVEMVMDLFGMHDALHIENDNLIYGLPDTEYLRSYCGGCIGLTEITETLLSAGVMYIGSAAALRAMNAKINNVMDVGQSELRKQYGDEMLNEMRLLKIVTTKWPEAAKVLPIFPTLDGKYVYDCASWGQYVGGTFETPDKPHSEDAHLIGRAINAGTYRIVWKTIDGLRIPHVLGCPERPECPLFNLHIHSKNLDKWRAG